MIVAGTGHRPPKLGGYSHDAASHRIRVAERALLELTPTRVISGMALGWDQALAVAATRLNIPFDAYIPGAWQPGNWPSPARTAWELLLGKASTVINCCPGSTYNREALLIRNRMMVDACDAVAALWDGSTGGTAHCISYAQRLGRPVHNFWEEFLK